MGRARAFDESDVLQGAMGVFWERGFRNTSVKDLERATGLNPGSLYHAYGSKHGLFVAVLDHYILAGLVLEHSWRNSAAEAGQS